MDYSLIMFFVVMLLFAILGGLVFIKLNSCKHIWVQTDRITL